MLRTLALMFFGCVVFMHYAVGCFQHRAVDDSARALAHTLSAHRAMCASFDQGCRIDARNLCTFSVRPGVRCRWYGAHEEMCVWHGPPAYTASMGRFVLRSGPYAAEVVMSLFGSSVIRWVDRKFE